MSTQSPHPPTPKGSRNNRRPQKKNTNPHAQKPVLLSTPPSSPPHNMSPGVIQVDSSTNFNSSKKKPIRSGKKPRDNKASPAPHSGYHSNGYNSGPRHTPTHPAVTSPQPKPSTAYAGPTFHASPAPSALPIPSFFSKSAPDANLVPPIETDSDDADVDPELEMTPSKPRNRNNQSKGEEHKPSPLDFLFKAAVQARDQKSTSSPEVNKVLQSPQTEPRAVRPNPDSMFAFEMGNPDYPRNSQIGPSFAPSYQDRMNALRPSSTPQSSDMTEEERRIKTEELKHLLLNPPPQKPPSSAYASHEYAGPFGPRPSNVPPYATPMRTLSGPQLTPSHGSFSPHHHHHQLPQNNGRPHYQYPSHSHSPLRREVDIVPPPSMPPYRGPVSNSGSNGGSPAPYGNLYMATSQHQRSGYASPQPNHASTSFQIPVNSPSPSRVVDTRQIENDIRRVLKLDASGPPVTQSFA